MTMLNDISQEFGDLLLSVRWSLEVEFSKELMNERQVTQRPLV